MLNSPRPLGNKTLPVLSPSEFYNLVDRNPDSRTQDGNLGLFRETRSGITQMCRNKRETRYWISRMNMGWGVWRKSRKIRELSPNLHCYGVQGWRSLLWDEWLDSRRISDIVWLFFKGINVWNIRFFVVYKRSRWKWGKSVVIESMITFELLKCVRKFRFFFRLIFGSFFDISFYGTSINFI